MRRLPLISRTLASVILCAAVLACSTETTETPESVVDAFWVAIQKEGVGKAIARFTHPDETARLKNTLMPRIRSSYETPGDEFVQRTFGRELQLQTLEAMSPQDFMAAFLWRGQLDGSEFKPPRFIKHERLGNVVRLEVDTEKISLEGKSVTTRSVIRLKPFGTTWRLLLPPETEAYMQVMSQQ